MDSQRLWAPWRLSYVKGQIPPAETTEQLNWLPGADEQCFLCRAVASTRDHENLVIHRSTQVLTVLNRFPYNNGHVLVSPCHHKADLAELGEEEQQEIARMLTRLTQEIARLMDAEGFNIGLNLGSAAGAGVPGHLHWHLVPRWRGDTNFMLSVASTKVIPQALDELWQVLHDALSGS